MSIRVTLQKYLNRQQFRLALKHNLRGKQAHHAVPVLCQWSWSFDWSLGDSREITDHHLMVLVALEGQLHVAEIAMPMLPCSYSLGICSAFYMLRVFSQTFGDYSFWRLAVILHSRHLQLCVSLLSESVNISVTTTTLKQLDCAVLSDVRCHCSIFSGSRWPICDNLHYTNIFSRSSHLLHIDMTSRPHSDPYCALILSRSCRYIVHLWRPFDNV